MMKRFYCQKCDTSSRRIETQIPVTVWADVYIDDDGKLAGSYDGEDVSEDELKAATLQCERCHAPVVVMDAPCTHKWGEMQIGFGGNTGRVRRVCRRCWAVQEGTVTLSDPVWNE